ncbi:thymidine kinase [Streptoalloteichus tenebrarius]|uniref:Thymidine kinase n=1 Tax=Streptoalloteichus tenebrarius (strain ATCC 17920 / DSM 40477 / JCM 4838 / CBS 697.72 / NBRC 16177 / NCIMB 11028 / NRRL B-12390 / A12253. 1 / ISP 5477) TaxID=1933 RepID=A0ABT1HPS7_STRSD|nr:thymidine kinase [Streptoalloteichus tenebrarius]MCP2257522.1 thymidine kinase [Streptoalloteichus tenebrarius]BFE98473.1 thymidine kinase [Streptoalloteichus tenebrarius]
MSTLPDPTDALSAVPAAGARRAVPAPGRLRFFYGPMDCGKSTLALQIDHNHARQGRRGMLLVRHDRSGMPQISSRIGITRGAVEVDERDDLRQLVRDRWALGQHVDYLIVDEAQFLSAEQVEQLAELADDVQVDVYCFGIATDFRSALFPGSQRLFELADELQAVQVEVLCWCGLPGRFNARVVDGRVVRAGDTVLVADTTAPTTQRARADTGPTITEGAGDANPEPATVRYQVLCRRHYRLGDLGPVVAREGQLSLT